MLSPLYSFIALLLDIGTLFTYGFISLMEKLLKINEWRLNFHILVVFHLLFYFILSIRKLSQVGKPPVCLFCLPLYLSGIALKIHSSYSQPHISGTEDIEPIQKTKNSVNSSIPKNLMIKRRCLLRNMSFKCPQTWFKLQLLQTV
jgi:hypothetical protein